MHWKRPNHRCIIENVKIFENEMWDVSNPVYAWSHKGHYVCHIVVNNMEYLWKEFFVFSVRLVSLFTSYILQFMTFFSLSFSVSIFLSFCHCFLFFFFFILMILIQIAFATFSIKLRFICVEWCSNIFCLNSFCLFSCLLASVFLSFFLAFLLSAIKSMVKKSNIDFLIYSNDVWICLLTCLCFFFHSFFFSHMLLLYVFSKCAKVIFVFFCILFIFIVAAMELELSFDFKIFRKWKCTHFQFYLIFFL